LTPEPLIVCVGTAVLDQIFRVEALPTAPGKHFASAYREVGGGPAANAAVTITRLGGRAVLWARVGADANGGRIVADLAAAGVDVTGVRRVDGAVSGVSAVIVDRRGERMIVNHSDPALDPDAAWLPTPSLSQAAAVLADVRWERGLVAAFAAARERNLLAILDADSVPEAIDPAPYQAATHVLFSEPALAQFSGESSVENGLRAAARRVGGWIGMTAGERGSFFLERDRIGHVPAFRVQAVDTLAAGDVFHGAFALALARCEGESAALRFASAAAALKCTRFGGRDGIPYAADLARFMAEAAA
jgi:sulfofructose kinase